MKFIPLHDPPFFSISEVSFSAATAHAARAPFELVFDPNLKYAMPLDFPPAKIQAVQQPSLTMCVISGSSEIEIPLPAS